MSLSRWLPDCFVASVSHLDEYTNMGFPFKNILLQTRYITHTHLHQHDDLAEYFKQTFIL